MMMTTTNRDALGHGIVARQARQARQIAAQCVIVHRASRIPGPALAGSLRVIVMAIRAAVAMMTPKTMIRAVDAAFCAATGMLPRIKVKRIRAAGVGFSAVARTTMNRALGQQVRFHLVVIAGCLIAAKRVTIKTRMMKRKAIYLAGLGGGVKLPMTPINRLKIV